MNNKQKAQLVSTYDQNLAVMVDKLKATEDKHVVNFHNTIISKLDWLDQIDDDSADYTIYSLALLGLTAAIIAAKDQTDEDSNSGSFDPLDN